MTPDEELPDALARADRALFQAKSKGRDRVMKGQEPSLSDAAADDRTDAADSVRVDRIPARAVPAA